MEAETIGLVSALTALAASVTAPVVTLVVSKRQFAASVLSTNRQRWIDALRESLSSLIAEMVSLSFLMRGRVAEGGPLDDRTLAGDPVVIARVERLILAFARIRLLLNADKPAHVELGRAIEHTLKCIKTRDVDEARFSAEIEEITKLSQAVLRSEWQRVKRGV
jgi:hypothetical protein